MSYEFEETDGNYEGSIAVQWGPKDIKWKVSKSAVLGFVFQYLQEVDGHPPLTAATMAWGSLCYGNQHPDLILSSEAMMKRMVRILKDDHRVPVMYGVNFGFRFMDAIWSHSDGTGVDIEEGWVFMLNRDNPTNFMLNGCYKPMMGDS